MGSEVNQLPGRGERVSRGRRRELTLTKKLCFTAVVIVLLPAFLLLAGEAVGRVVMHVQHGVPGKVYGLYMSDDELGATHRPQSYNSNSVTNNCGFRNVNDISRDKPPGATRIYCSGGSTTFCYNLVTEDSWPSLLQQKLRRISGHERDEVLNAGQICFAVSQEYVLARRFVPTLKPDVVILFTGVNELLAAETLEGRDGLVLDELLAEQQWTVCPQHLDQARFLKRNSILVRLWDYKIKKWLEPQLTADYRSSSAPAREIHPWVVANFDHTLRAFIDYLRAHDCKVIILRYGDNGVENWHLTECLRMFRERAVAIGHEKGVTICDFASVVEDHPRRADLFIESGVHVSRAGAELLADELLRTLSQMNVVSFEQS